jgi:hypothetical protein
MDQRREEEEEKEEEKEEAAVRGRREEERAALGGGGWTARVEGERRPLWRTRGRAGKLRVKRRRLSPPRLEEGEVEVVMCCLFPPSLPPP